MSCERPPAQLYRYLDGELAPPEAEEMAQHLQTCSACQAEEAAHRRLQGLLRTAVQEDEVPEQLWTAIHQRLAQEPQARRPQAPGPPRHRLWQCLGTLAALLLVAFAVRLWLTPTVPVLVQEVVDSQIRARLMSAWYTTPVPATPDAIRHWFDEKVDFAVPVPVLPQAQYSFVGARLNYFLNRRVAEIAYTSQGHVLSFVMFANTGITLSDMSPVRVGSRTVYVKTYKGYTTVFWQDGTLFCGLVSDLRLPAVLEALRQAQGVT
jgi:mycothiol system anti-sigma-R factor